jgi:hypothetical protein
MGKEIIAVEKKCEEGCYMFDSMKREKYNVVCFLHFFCFLRLCAQSQEAISVLFGLRFTTIEGTNSLRPLDSIRVGRPLYSSSLFILDTTCSTAASALVQLDVSEPA